MWRTGVLGQIQTGDPSLGVIRVSALLKAIEPDRGEAKRVWVEQRGA